MSKSECLNIVGKLKFLSLDANKSLANLVCELKKMTMRKAFKSLMVCKRFRKNCCHSRAQTFLIENIRSVSPKIAITKLDLPPPWGGYGWQDITQKILSQIQVRISSQKTRQHWNLILASIFSDTLCLLRLTFSRFERYIVGSNNGPMIINRIDFCPGSSYVSTVVCTSVV